MITTVTLREGTPWFEGPFLEGNEPGVVTMSDGTQIQMTGEQYIALLRDHYPESITDREPCPRCGR